MRPTLPRAVEQLGHAKSVFDSGWPAFDAALAAEERVEMVVQVNGKVRGKVSLAREVTESEALAAALADPAIARFVPGAPKKVVYVKGQAFEHSDLGCWVCAGVGRC